MLDKESHTPLEKITSQLQGVGIGMALSKFVELNYSVFQEFRKLHVPQKTQAKIVSSSIGKTVGVSSLAVAISRLKEVPETANFPIIVEKKISERFVPKEAKLVLGTQKEKVHITTKSGISKIEERIIDWRGLVLNEKVSNWILEYKEKLVAVNLTGWRWNQIADAINNHLGLEKRITANTLTSVISLANKKITKNK